MELNIQETYDEITQNQELTYDDILTSLNVRLREGKLESLKPKYSNQNSVYQQSSNNNNKNSVYNKVSTTRTYPQRPMQRPMQRSIQQPMQRSIQRPIQQPMQQVPFNNQPIENGETIQEPNLLEKQKQYFQHKIEMERERINNIKSKKLLFMNGNNTNINITTRNQGGLNKLFKFK
jgi:hypothetical protein